ncbi:MAG: hypothetical protein QNJ41_26915 [Xenococcaceae cyanobacterium MO_188.B32]|nr:hypothetical protein [Xenococcaceae cyanobacterium MO_188.B32]
MNSSILKQFQSIIDPIHTSNLFELSDQKLMIRLPKQWKQYHYWSLLKRLRTRIIKESLRFRYFQSISQVAYQKAVRKYAANLPPLSAADMAIVDALDREGVFVTSLEQLEISSTPLLLNACQHILPKIKTISPKHNQQYVIHATSSQLMEYPEIFNWGLEEKLLDIIENYLSLPTICHGVYLRRDLTNQVQKKSRLWHLDREDRRMFKIIIYLNDVNEEGGPFQYIPKSLTSITSRALKYDYSYIDDKTMEQVVPSSEWKSCLGSAGTVVIADTASIFHRGKKSLVSDRLAIFFDYTSRRPKHPHYCKSFFSVDELNILTHNLSQRQNDCVWGNQRLLF